VDTSEKIARAQQFAESKALRFFELPVENIDEYFAVSFHFQDQSWTIAYDPDRSIMRFLRSGKTVGNEQPYVDPDPV